MTTIFINASPNKEGMTSKWGAKVLEGIDYERIDLVDFHIAQLGQVKANDDFDAVMDRLAKANYVVIGTPIYWWDISGLLKTFIDRWTELFQIGLDSENAPLHQLPVLWIVQGAAPEEAIPGIVRMLENISERFMMDSQGILYQKKQISEANRQLKQMLVDKNK
ncbi:flavodoxin family protein [Enterococcus faecium]|nr:flavodoxin family protein [Enterococcus faecium]